MSTWEIREITFPFSVKHESEPDYPVADAFSKQVARRPAVCCVGITIFVLLLAPLAIAIRGVPSAGLKEATLGIDPRHVEHGYGVALDHAIHSATGKCNLVSFPNAECQGAGYPVSSVKKMLPELIFRRVLALAQDEYGDFSIKLIQLMAEFALQSAANLLGIVVEGPSTINTVAESLLQYALAVVHGRHDGNASPEEVAEVLKRGFLQAVSQATGPLLKLLETIFGHAIALANAGDFTKKQGNCEDKPVGFSHDDTCSGFTKNRLPLTAPNFCMPQFDLIRSVIWFSADDIFTPENIQHTCEMAKVFASNGKTICQMKNGEVCESESLASAIQQITNQGEQCIVSQAAIDEFRDELADCFPFKKDLIEIHITWELFLAARAYWYFTEFALKTKMEQVQLIKEHFVKSAMPTKCLEQVSTWTLVFRYLLPKNFEPTKKTSEVVVLLPIYSDGEFPDNFNDIYNGAVKPMLAKHGESESSVVIQGVSLGGELGKMLGFQAMLMNSLLYVGLAFAVIFLLMWFHTASFFLSFFAFIAIFLSVSITIFVYQIVFWQAFFPFMNLVNFFVLVGIGADDVFVFVDTWKQSFLVIPHAPMENRIAWVLRRAAGATLVTSITTSVAFLANIASPLTTLKSFGIYSGISIIANYCLLVALLPCLLVLSTSPTLEKMAQSIREPLSKHVKFSWPMKGNIYEKFEKLGAGIYRFRYPFAICFLALGCAMIPVALSFPRPQTDKVPILLKSHLMGNWDQDGFSRFSFSSSLDGDLGYMNIEIVFGVEESETGSSFVPYPALKTPYGYMPYTDLSLTEEEVAPLEAAIGTPKYVTMDLFTEKSQEFLVKVCNDATNQSWFRGEILEERRDDFLAGCWPVALESWAKSNCDGISKSCFTRWLSHVQATGRYTNATSPFRFEKDELKLMFLSLPTNIPTGGIFDDKEQFLKTIESWAEILESAPEGLQGWWYSRDLGFHILQKSLLDGALESCLISLVAAFIALVVFTRNFAASLLATASILLSVVCIVACMVGFGWTLNLAEAIILSLGIGVSVDFACHLTHAYEHNDGTTPKERLQKASGTLGASVTMASLTTILAGCCMLPAEPLLFVRFGVFLIVAMFWSWMYVFFFLLPLLGIVGPKPCVCKPSIESKDTE